MNKSSSSDDWLQAELADVLDENLELELSEPALSEEIRKIYKDSHPRSIERILPASSYAAGRAHQVAGLGPAH
jgi:polyphosphate kinase